SNAVQGEQELAPRVFVVLFGGATKEHIQAHRVRELGAGAEAAVTVVEARNELAACSVEQIGPRRVRRGAAAFELVQARQAVGELARLYLDVRPLRAIGVGDGAKHGRKSRHPV